MVVKVFVFSEFGNFGKISSLKFCQKTVFSGTFTEIMTDCSSPCRVSMSPSRVAGRHRHAVCD
jgi:hypothetical protein